MRQARDNLPHTTTAAAGRVTCTKGIDSEYYKLIITKV